MQPLDIHTFPLTGQSLIEASAGTGKTYTITSLYTRLLLGHNTHQGGPLACDRILVVTFTNAATEELRGRIRGRIRAVSEDVLRLLSCRDTVAIDDDLRRWLTELGFLSPLNSKTDHAHADLDALSDWLVTNLSQMDNASIFTIHGFCQRMLKQFAFDSGVMFSAELILDARSYLRQACEDVWRNGNYRLNREQVGYLMDCYPSPEALQRQVQNWLSHPGLTFLPDAVDTGREGFDELTFSDEWQDLNDQFSKLREAWRGVGLDTIEGIVAQSDVDKRSYTKKNLPRWLQKANAYLVAEFSLPVAAELSHFGQRHLNAKTKDTKAGKGTPPEHSLFRRVDAFMDRVRELAVSLPQVWFGLVKERYVELLTRGGVMSPDDLLRLLDDALNGPQGEHLAGQIRRLYPVGLIDEFQDTDPLQYRIFSRIYPSTLCASPSASGTNETDTSDDRWGLTAIGDPKQAIYAFRGADIFTYIEARRALDYTPEAQADDRIFTLETNWRSHSSLINGVNLLFANHPEPFVFRKDIPFAPVKAAGKHDHQAFVAPDTKEEESQAAPLQLWLDDRPLSLPVARMQAAEQCANQILALLTGKGKLGEQVVHAADIAILVRSHHQAELMRQALSAEGIGSVFLSRDSVLHTREARDMLLWLMAVAEPSDERVVRQAMSTETQGFSAHQLDHLLNDEAAWEQQLERVTAYHQCWQQRGIVAAVMLWLDDDGRAARLRCLVEGERRLTNVLHLAEMLQQTSRRLRGHLSLLRWFTEQVLDDALPGDEAQLRLETDANLVSIVTIHKSKGLEYPLVFLPFLWSDDYTSQKGGHARYYDDQHGVVVNLEPDDAARQAQHRDNKAEAMRLLYVALTRPVQGCFIWLMNAGKSSKKQGWSPRILNTALGNLLLPEGLSAANAPSDESTWVQAMKCRWHEIGLNNHADSLSFGVMPSWVAGRALLGTGSTSGVTAARFTRYLSRHWRVSSFTQLNQAVAHRDAILPSESQVAPGVAPVGQRSESDVFELPDSSFRRVSQPWDPGLDDGRLRDDEPFAGSLGSWELEGIGNLESDFIPLSSDRLAALHFPRGAAPGTCLHAMLEHWDFQARSSLIVDIVPRELAQFGIGVPNHISLESTHDAELIWHEQIADWLHRIVNTPLISGLPEAAALTLAAVDVGQRLDEMEFYLPIRPDIGVLHSHVVDRLLAAQRGKVGVSGASSSNMNSRLNFEPLSGYIKGFIDLVFCHQGRYYLVDYKSNWLGDQPEDYAQAGLHTAMVDHGYDLQAWIYTLALDQLLRQRLTNYDPAEHLGGVFYLFLRGMTQGASTMPEKGGSADLFAMVETREPEYETGVFYQAVDVDQLRHWRRELLGVTASADDQDEQQAERTEKSVKDERL